MKMREMTKMVEHELALILKKMEKNQRETYDGIQIVCGKGVDGKVDRKRNFNEC